MTTTVRLNPDLTSELQTGTEIVVEFAPSGQLPDLPTTKPTPGVPTHQEPTELHASRFTSDFQDSNAHKETVQIDPPSNRDTATNQSPQPGNFFRGLGEKTRKERIGKCKRCCTDYCSRSLCNAFLFQTLSIIVIAISFFLWWEWLNMAELHTDDGTWVFQIAFGAFVPIICLSFTIQFCIIWWKEVKNKRENFLLSVLEEKYESPFGVNVFGDRIINAPKK